MEPRIEEKRRFPRLKLQTELGYNVRGKRDFNNTLTDDISLGGANFTTDKFLAPDTLLMTRINVLARTLAPIARVAWVNALPHTNRYKFGVEFIEVDPGDKKYLSDYLQMRTEQM